jgi:hypothetical protein
VQPRQLQPSTQTIFQREWVIQHSFLFWVNDKANERWDDLNMAYKVEKERDTN